MADGSEGHDSGEKAERILLACEKRDLDSLRELASSQNGLVGDDFRQAACASMLDHAPLSMRSFGARATSFGQ